MNTLSMLGALALTLSSFTAAQAATFEDAGTVQQVMVERSLIEVNDKLYSLPSTVTAGQNASSGPIIFQLRRGTVVGFSGHDASLEHPLINSMVIHRQPTPEEELELLQEQPNE